MTQLTSTRRTPATDEEVKAAIRLLVDNFGGLIVLGNRGASLVAFLNGDETSVPARWTVDYPTRPEPGGPMRRVQITAGWTERAWRERPR